MTEIERQTLDEVTERIYKGNVPEETKLIGFAYKDGKWTCLKAAPQRRPLGLVGIVLLALCGWWPIYGAYSLCVWVDNTAPVAVWYWWGPLGLVCLAGVVAMTVFFILWILALVYLINYWDPPSKSCHQSNKRESTDSLW